MDGVLLERGESSPALADQATLVARLLAEVDQLRAEVAQLRRENLELRQQVGYWKSMHARACQRLEEVQQEVERLRGENRKLQAQLFGRKSEKQSGRDRGNDLEDPHETATQPPRRRGQQPDQPGPQRRDYEHLPVREEDVELPAEQQVCPECGQPLKLRSDTEDAEQIEIEVCAYRRRFRRRRYHGGCSCRPGRVVTAPPPPKLIPKGLYGTSVWVEILVDKFYGYRPTERLLAQLRLLDLDLAAGTVADGLRRLEPLFTPLYEACCDRNRQSVYRQADETRWLVFVDQAGKSNHCWWLWAFSGEDTVVYLLDPSRSHTVPEGHYPADLRGVLMVDRLSSYKAMAQVKNGTVLLAYCWAHVRRDFVRVGKGWPEQTAWALAWLRRIRELYRLQRQRLAVLSCPRELAQAESALRGAVLAMRLHMEAELAEAQLPTPCRKVLESLHNHWQGLTLFVDDPRIPLDNNASERRLRGPAVGRKNYYGSGALWSGRLAAMLFSLLATLKLWQLNPRKWLHWYLTSCAEAGGHAPADCAAFLPWNLTAEQRQALAEEGPPPTSDSS